MLVIWVLTLAYAEREIQSIDLGCQKKYGNTLKRVVYICASHSDKQPSEPLHMHETPTRPWERVGCDIFTIRSRNYLVTVDYCSNFFEVDFLPETDSSTVITKLKHHFARHSIPDVVKTDNGTQFISNSFKNFST